MAEILFIVENVDRRWCNHGISSTVIIEDYAESEGRENIRINPDGTLWVNQRRRELGEPFCFKLTLEVV